MSSICPTVTAYDLHEYREQLTRISGFAKRIHIDLMDGVFAPTKSPDIEKLWFEKGIETDVHVMFQHPDRQIKKLLNHSPSLIVVQAEADNESVMRCIDGLRKTRVRVGVSLLADTRPSEPFVSNCIEKAHHVLIFSGHLGYHGGKAQLELLAKVEQIRAINPNVEIGWDGGINSFNAKQIADAGVDVLNVGGYIQKSNDPVGAYHKILDSLE